MATKASNEPTKLALALAKRINDEFGFIVKPFVHRNYPGYWQRKEGVSSWFMELEKDDGLTTIGSQHRAKDVLAAQKISILDWTRQRDYQIFIENIKNNGETVGNE